MLYFMLTKLCSDRPHVPVLARRFVMFFLKSIAKATAAEGRSSDRVANSRRDAAHDHLHLGLARPLQRHKLIFLAASRFGLMLGAARCGRRLDRHLRSSHLSEARRGRKSDENPLIMAAADEAVAGGAALSSSSTTSAASPDNVVEAAPRFREWYNHVTPESEKLPLDWAGPRPRRRSRRCWWCAALRPDRMVSHWPTSSRRHARTVATTDCDAPEQRRDPRAVDQDSTPADAHLLHPVARRGRRGRPR